MGRPKAYLAGTDNGIATRTWQQAIESLTSTKQGENQHRWRTAARDKAFAPLRPRIIIETPGELLLKVLQTGTHLFQHTLRRSEMKRSPVRRPERALVTAAGKSSKVAK